MQGIVKDYKGLVITRVFLGVTEAGFFPASTYLLTTWYCRWEYQTRVAIFFSAASLAGSFSGLLAYAIQHMEGVAGLSGWRWIFILEGILTVTIGVFVPWILPDSPGTAKFLSEQEKAYIQYRLQQDAGTSSGEVALDEKFQWKFLKEALLDYKIYLGIVMYWGNRYVLDRGNKSTRFTDEWLQHLYLRLQFRGPQHHPTIRLFSRQRSAPYHPHLFPWGMRHISVCEAGR